MSQFTCEHAALLLIDVQPDFLPGGPLACVEGDAILPGIGALLKAGVFRHVVATQDWHPRGHVSFASSHANRQPLDRIPLWGHAQTVWPTHGVQGTPGAALHPSIDWSPVDLILRKGMDPRVDSYSAFRENHGPSGTRNSTGLAGWLRERGVFEVYVAGLSREFCVMWTVQDAADLGFKVHVLWDLTRPMNPESDIQTRARYERLDVDVMDSRQLFDRMPMSQAG